MSLIGPVRRTLSRFQLASPSTRVVVALSGGPDSVALLSVLRVLHERGELQLAGIAHLNHQLREAAAADEQFCEALARQLGLPLVCERVDVRAVAARTHRSLEDAAHAVRYEFFQRALDTLRADVMAVGHTRDDQAETFLLRLIRGAGSRGLAAMFPRSGPVIRPLLECDRADVRAYAEASGLGFVHDATNDDVGIPRNRVRAELLPLLAGRFNPRIVEALAHGAELARADETLIAGLVTEWTAAHAVQVGDRVWQVSASELLAAPQAIGLRALHDLMRRVSGRQVGLDDVMRAWNVAEGDGADFDAPGHRVQRDRGYVVLTGRPPGSAGRQSAASTRSVPDFCHRLAVPGEVEVPEVGCVVSAEVACSAEAAPELNRAAHLNRVTALVPKNMVGDGLAVRNRRSGDRFRPTRAGHRKLQDLFVDRKVPRDVRDRIPIVTTADDRIVWVVGHGIDADFQVTDPVQAVVILRLKGVGGSC